MRNASCMSTMVFCRVLFSAQFDLPASFVLFVSSLLFIVPQSLPVALSLTLSIFLSLLLFLTVAFSLSHSTNSSISIDIVLRLLRSVSAKCFGDIGYISGNCGGVTDYDHINAIV